jgi:hypothetical protein
VGVPIPSGEGNQGVVVGYICQQAPPGRRQLTLKQAERESRVIEREFADGRSGERVSTLVG